MLTRNGAVIGATAVFHLGGAVVPTFRALAVFGFAQIAALLVAGLWMRARPRLDVEREISPLRVTEGEVAVAVLTVTNLSSRRCPPISAIESTSASESTGEHAITVRLPSLAARATHRIRFPLPTERRGVYLFGPPRIEYSDPLRLMASVESYSVACTLYVHPAVDLVKPLPAGSGRDEDGPTSSLAPQGGIAFHSLREYVHGDDWRLVHWRSSARTGRLLIRHNVVPQDPRMMVVLDTSESAYDNDDAFENAVRATASWCVAALRNRFPVHLYTTAGETMVAAESGHEQTAILDLLAAVRRGPANPGLAVLPSLEPGTGCVSLGVVTGRPTPVLLGTLPTVRPRFRTVSLVQFAPFAEAPARLPGVLSVSARRPSEFVAAWNDLVGS